MLDVLGSLDSMIHCFNAKIGIGLVPDMGQLLVFKKIALPIINGVFYIKKAKVIAIAVLDYSINIGSMMLCYW